MDFKTEFFKFAKDMLVEAEDVINDARTETVPNLVVDVYNALDKASARVVELQEKVNSKLN